MTAGAGDPDRTDPTRWPWATDGDLETSCVPVGPAASPLAPLTQGVPLEDVQYLAGHAEPRTTGPYDRRQKRVTRNIVERISI
jgi:hypothetical protein